MIRDSFPSQSPHLSLPANLQNKSLFCVLREAAKKWSLPRFDHLSPYKMVNFSFFYFYQYLVDFYWRARRLSSGIWKALQLLLMLSIHFECPPSASIFVARSIWSNRCVCDTFVLLPVLTAAETRLASLFIITLDSTASTPSQTSTITGSTLTATEANLQKQILQENLLALQRAEEQIKRENEHKKKKHYAKIATLTGTTPTCDESKNKIIFQILKISKYFLGIPKTHFFTIFSSKFDFYNFYKLRALHANEDFGTQQILIFEGNNFQIQKPKNKLKDYSIFHSI